MAEGRGAWTTRGHDTGSIYYAVPDGTSPEQYDGANPDASEWHDRVTRGVRAIDKLLTLAGHPASDAKPKSIFDPEMADRVKSFQVTNGITGSGFVGGITMRALVLPHAESSALAQAVAPRWPLAMIQKEANFDPGAQGWAHSPDSGLMQFNTEATEVTLDEAFSPLFAIRAGVTRFRTARDKYLQEKPKARSLAISCAIASHNSPVWADEWFSTGSAPNVIISEYVSLTREYAQDWRAIFAT